MLIIIKRPDIIKQGRPYQSYARGTLWPTKELQKDEPLRLSRPRIEPLSEETMNDDQTAMIAPLKERYGFAFNVLKTLMHHMPLLNAWNPFAGHVMATSSLTPRVREIAIMRVGWLTRSEYEWGQHVLMSKPAGLTHDDHLRIIEGAEAPGWNADEQAIITMTDELLRDTIISDQTWSSLKKCFSDQQILDAIFTVGQYNMLAMALNSLGVQREQGVPGFPLTPIPEGDFNAV